MIRRWTRSLATQLITFTLAALVFAQAITFVISWKEHSKALDAAAKSEFFSRARTMTRLMTTAAPEFRRDALVASETGDSRFWLTDEDTRDVGAWRLDATQQFARPLENFVDLVQVFGGAPAVAEVPDAKRVAASNRGEDWKVPMQDLWALPQPVRYVYFDGTRGYGMVITLDDGSYLNTAFYMKNVGGWWTSTSLSSLLLTATILTLLGVLIASRIAHPLRDLAKSAEALGRGENLPALREEGPEEIRLTASAFNQMQARLHRFIDDRTKMLGAIGHDLRTPLTSLRLRAEFVKDPEVQQKMLATIAEMQAMTEAAISFAKGEYPEEETRPIQLEALLSSICDDHEDLGQSVTFLSYGRTTYRCRPDGLRRAVRNLVENAVRYGDEAKVFVRHTANSVEIVVEDRGPGIPETMRESVFAPFFRLEASRNKDTGGIGLGLSIARAVARQHGGDILFASCETGMQAVVSLPFNAGTEQSMQSRSRPWPLERTVARMLRRRRSAIETRS